MSIKYSMAAFCDGCGKELERAEDVKATMIDSTRWDWQSKWRKDGTMLRYRKFRATQIFCQPCADGAPKR